MKTYVFYDGDCGLCQRSIAFLARADVEKKLIFAPLNGKTYKEIYVGELSLLTTVKVYSDNKSFEKSSAFIKLGEVLGGRYRLLTILWVVPAFIRNFIYDLIAKNRKKLSCYLVTKDERFVE